MKHSWHTEYDIDFFLFLTLKFSTFVVGVGASVALRRVGEFDQECLYRHYS